EFTSFMPALWQGMELSEEEQIQKIREMLGEEGAEVLIPLYKEAYPERRLIDLLRLDFMFRAPEIEYIAVRSRLNDCTWSYMFNMDQPVYGGGTPWHCADIPYVFNNIDLVEYPHGPQEEGLSERIQKQCYESVMAFARTGCPDNDSIPAWPASAEGAEKTLIIDADTRVRENYDHALMAEFVKYMGPVFGRMMAEMMGSVQH
ncbi:MAG: carboxylesterase family protein, partial [Lachnospiraceae bacterium]|nr:carboxylesterase family protein [Lachnospiraceae bacterium]